MPRSPSIVPDDTNRDVYLVLDDFGPLGRAWRETDEAGTSRTSLVRNLLAGQYEDPVRIVAFNTAQGWSRDVTVDIADELRRTLRRIRRGTGIGSQVLGSDQPALKGYGQRTGAACRLCVPRIWARSSGNTSTATASFTHS
jgi:hypothetical protein